MAITTQYNSQYHSTDYDRSTQAKLVGQGNESRTRTVIAWALQIIVALAFLAAGGAKVTGQPMMVEVFAKIGIGQWFRYVTGIIEIASAILLFSPRTAAVGAFFLACTMVGALIAHAFILGGNVLPPAMLFVGAVAIVALRWNRARAMIKQENVVNV